jgi:hypothetical protein
LLLTVTSTNGFYSLPFEQKWFETGLNVNIVLVYGNLKIMARNLNEIVFSRKKFIPEGEF